MSSSYAASWYDRSKRKITSPSRYVPLLQTHCLVLQTMNDGHQKVLASTYYLQMIFFFVCLHLSFCCNDNKPKAYIENDLSTQWHRKSNMFITPASYDDDNDHRILATKWIVFSKQIKQRVERWPLMARER